MDDVQPREPEVPERDMHRARQGRRCRSLELESDPGCPACDEQIEFRAGMSSPEIALFRKRSETHHDRIESEPLPGRSDFRVRLDLSSAPETEQRMEQAAVPEVDLRRLDLPLAYVLVPGRELSDHEGCAEQIEVALYGGVRNTERSCKLGSIPHLTVVMSEHHPESPQSGGGKPQAQGRNVPLEEGSNERDAPPETLWIGARQKRPREASPEPKSWPLPSSDLTHGEAVQLMVRDPSGEGLRGLPQQIGRRASQNQDPSFRPWLVHEYAEVGE